MARFAFVFSLYCMLFLNRLGRLIGIYLGRLTFFSFVSTLGHVVSLAKFLLSCDLDVLCFPLNKIQLSSDMFSKKS
jgi:hypothetical protein